MLNKQNSLRFLSFSGLLCIIIFSAFRTPHPFYVSVTELRADTLTKKLSISCRMFTDDLQDALYKLYGHREEIRPGEMSEENKRILSDYLLERLSVSFGNENLNLKFIGYEIEEEATWCYLETIFKQWKPEVKIRNSVLYDYLPSQSNIMHFYLQDERQSLKLNNPEKEARFSFDHSK